MSKSSIYVNKEKIAKDFVAIKPGDRKPIVFNKGELIYAGELKVGKCRPDKEGDNEFNVMCERSGQSECFYLKVSNAKNVRIIIETESGKNIWIPSNETSCNENEEKGKYKADVTVSDTGVIIVIENCESFHLRYEIIS